MEFYSQIDRALKIFHYRVILNKNAIFILKTEYFTNLARTLRKSKQKFVLIKSLQQTPNKFQGCLKIGAKV